MPRHEHTALVVDDDVFVLSALAELLSEEGFDVHTASNGFSASRVAVECRPAVILLDVKLPERSGAELLAELRNDPATRDSAIVVISAYANLLSDAERAQADAIVPKPFDVPELLSIIERELQRAAARRSEVPRVASAAHPRAAGWVRRASANRGARPRR
jgi:CheY-like chemotaxis protein